MAGDLIEYADPVLTDTGDLGLDLAALNAMMTFEGEIGAALIGPSSSGSSGSSGSDASAPPSASVVKAAALGGLSLNPLLILALIVIVVIMMDER